MLSNELQARVMKHLQKMLEKTQPYNMCTCSIELWKQHQDDKTLLSAEPCQGAMCALETYSMIQDPYAQQDLAETCPEGSVPTMLLHYGRSNNIEMVRVLLNRITTDSNFDRMSMLVLLAGERKDTLLLKLMEQFFGAFLMRHKGPDALRTMFPSASFSGVFWVMYDAFLAGRGMFRQCTVFSNFVAKQVAETVFGVSYESEKKFAGTFKKAVKSLVRMGVDVGALANKSLLRMMPSTPKSVFQKRIAMILKSCPITDQVYHKCVMACNSGRSRSLERFIKKVAKITPNELYPRKFKHPLILVMHDHCAFGINHTGNWPHSTVYDHWKDHGAYWLRVAVECTSIPEHNFYQSWADAKPLLHAIANYLEIAWPEELGERPNIHPLLAAGMFPFVHPLSEDDKDPKSIALYQQYLDNQAEYLRTKGIAGDLLATKHDVSEMEVSRPKKRKRLWILGVEF